MDHTYKLTDEQRRNHTLLRHVDRTQLTIRAGAQELLEGMPHIKLRADGECTNR